MREVNERIADLYRTELPVTEFELLCECSQEDCRERISMTVAEYRDLRGREGRFAVAPAHAVAGDRVVTDGERFTVIELTT
jgi:hypothetical protein